MEDVSKAMQQLMSQRHLNANYRQLMAKVYADQTVQQFYHDHKAELAEDVLDRSAAKLYEFVSERAKVAQGGETFAAGYEPQLIVSNHLIDVAYVPTKATQEKQAQQQLRQRVRSIAMPKDIRNAQLDNFDHDEERMEALMAAYDFIETYEASPHRRHQALYLAGSFGVGKTYLLAAIANQLANDGFSSTLVHFPSFAVEMKNAIAQNGVGDKLDALKRAPVLMIDDIGADAMSAWVRDDILGVILEYRMQEELPTFFSSNFSMAQLENEHLRISSRGDDEPLKAQRLMQRIRFLSREITMVGVNRRPQ
ncbi:primosomal protein DnaI [Levilactobacillus namurensis DSM 19117]|uniref:Primosomal protein DnaI n=2 Tax=Levilactobacillus namurensis TaxID=380393 RepID=A0A0R1KBS8_9LACO|nr:primosomal protein DnaI [Levilactobacillus namurensis]KRK77234.1 primosomal protein DnaI [Levilactobacillus namurensis DSM 19117]MCW3777652.1 primosomal protein DnaI [Levilactobacillus namurensis]MDT7014216.1 primosomal protein DnaI [Levilactobacillus namurensis]MDT7018852.1 primosomal protein DnaI [Levilactobacillus namurensis]WNN66534.1 primosomal protein DnaI [Levilactobacillus namurensis]